MDWSHFVRNSRSTSAIGFAASLAVAGLLIARSGSTAIKTAEAHGPSPAAKTPSSDPTAPAPSFRMDSNWRLGAASWETEIEEPEAPDPLDPESETQDNRFAGLDIAAGRNR